MMPLSGPSRGLGLGLSWATMVVLADQFTKWLATSQLGDGHRVVLLDSFFEFVLVHNVGAAFGMFQTITPLWRNLFLGSVAFGAIVFILFQLRQTQNPWLIGGFGFILGGAVGNLVDRFRFGWVVDFIHVHWDELSWPVFNLADSAITVGVLILLIDNFRGEEKGEP